MQVTGSRDGRLCLNLVRIYCLTLAFLTFNFLTLDFICQSPVGDLSKTKLN